MIEHSQKYSFYPNKKCCNKKVCNIFEKLCYKNWYNRERLCKQAIPIVFFVSVNIPAGGNPAGFLLNFVF